VVKKIANELNNRSGNSVKNRFYTVLLKTYINGKSAAPCLVENNNSNIEISTSVSSETFIEVKTAKKNIFYIYSDSNKSDNNNKTLNETKVNKKRCFEILKNSKFGNENISTSNENYNAYECNSNLFSLEEETSHSMQLDFDLIETSSTDLNHNSINKEDTNSLPTIQTSEYSDSCSIGNFFTSIPKQNDIDIYSYGLPMSCYNKSGFIPFEELIALGKSDIATLMTSQGEHGEENYLFPGTFN